MSLRSPVRLLPQCNTSQVPYCGQLSGQLPPHLERRLRLLVAAPGSLVSPGRLTGRGTAATMRRFLGQGARRTACACSTKSPWRHSSL